MTNNKDNTNNYNIPVPARITFRPLVQLPWGALSVSKMLSNSKHAIELLQQKIKEWYGVKHCILTDSARSAYAVYLRSSGFSGELIMPSLMYTPLATLLKSHGLSFAFCDVEPNYNISVDSFKSLITPKTRGVLVQHMFGHAAPLDKIYSIAKEHSLTVMSNMVQMPGGVTLNDKPLTTYCDVGFVSFCWDKPLQGIYGGALLTNSDDIYEKARTIHMQDTSAINAVLNIIRALILYRHKPLLGPLQYMISAMRGTYYKSDAAENIYNAFPNDYYDGFKPSTLHPWQAAFAEKLIDQSPDMMSKRAECARIANSLLSAIPEATPPPTDSLPNTFIYYPVQFDESISRYELGVELARRGIEAKWRYYPLHLQAKFKEYRTANLSNTTKMWKHYLLLPVLTGSSEDITRVINILQASIDRIKNS